MPTRVERVAPAEPAQRQPAATHRSVGGHRIGGVGAAAGEEPTAGSEQRRHEPPIAGEGRHQDAGGRAHRASRSRAPHRSRRSDALSAPAADGVARTTTRVPTGRSGTSSRSWCRTFRDTRERTTEPPTALLTTRPARGEHTCDVWSRCTVSNGPDARRPRRTTSENSVRRRRRFSEDSTGPASRREVQTRSPVKGVPRLRQTIRPRARCGPCGDGLRGSRDRPACSCAAESRGSWRDDGCSAEKCACSRATAPATHGGPVPGTRPS